MNRNTVVITGGAGYVGSALFKVLSYSKYFKIIIIDKGMFGINHITDSSFFDNRNMNFLKCPLEDAIENVDWKNVKAVIHLSGLSNDPLADFNINANLKMNYEDTVKLYQVVRENEVPRFIYASSASVYGQDDAQEVTENCEVNPLSNYAISKRKSEIEIQKYADYKNWVILRKGTIMGVSERMRFDLVVNAMVKDHCSTGQINIMGGGENWRPMLSIKDIKRIYASLVTCSDEEFESVKGEIYNVAGKNYRVSEIGLRIANQLNSRIVTSYISKDVRSYRLNTKKFEERLMKIDNLHKTEMQPLNEIVSDICNWIRINKPDFNDPIYYNIKWIKNCERVCKNLGLEYDICK